MELNVVFLLVPKNKEYSKSSTSDILMLAVRKSGFKDTEESEKNYK